MFVIIGQAETETLKKQYQKLMDGYGCLGVLKLNIGESSSLQTVVHMLLLNLTTSAFWPTV